MHHINNFEHDRYDAPRYKAFKKYGLENFEVKILITFRDALSQRTRQELDYYEKKYIEEYNSYGPTGYNQTKGGDAGIPGYVFNKEQLNRKSKNTLKVMHDGRNTIYCYDVKTNTLISALTMTDLSAKLGITLRNGDIRSLLSRRRYLLSRTLEGIEEKKKKYREYKKSGKLYGQYMRKITSEAINAIKNGMREKDWILKFGMCKKTYYTWKGRLIPRNKENK